MGGFSGGRRRAFRSRHRTPMGEGGRLAVIFVSLALILFVFAVMLGNHLRNLAEGVELGEGSEETTERELYYANVPDSLIARGILFGVDYAEENDITTENAESTEVETLPEDTQNDEPIEDEIGYDAVSVTLRQKSADGGMALAYFSPISLEYSIDRVGEVSLSDGIALIADNWGTRTKLCGIFEIDHPNVPEGNREIVRAYEIALICELIDAGVDEILLVGFAADTDAGVSFISDVYKRAGRRTAIGLALPFDYINFSGKTALDELSKKCAFLAIDLYSPSVPILMTPEELIADRISRVADLCREFSLRILLGCGKEPDGDSQTRTAMKFGFENTVVGLGLPSALEAEETEAETTE